MNINDDIKNIRYNLFKDRFINELNCLDEDMFMVVNDNYRTKQLKYIIERCKNVTEKKIAGDTLQDYLKNIINMSYKKKWRQLTPMQKQTKLKEYAATLDNKLNSKKLLLNSLKNKKLKEKNVKYNKTTSKIDKITNLTLNEELNKYELKN